MTPTLTLKMAHQVTHGGMWQRLQEVLHGHQQSSAGPALAGGAVGAGLGAAAGYGIRDRSASLEAIAHALHGAIRA